MSQALATTGGIDGTSDGRSALESRFHVVALVFQRVRQLKNGAPPRVDPAGHKPLHLALLEVLANTVPWTISPKAP